MQHTGVQQQQRTLHTTQRAIQPYHTAASYGLAWHATYGHRYTPDGAPHAFLIEVPGPALLSDGPLSYTPHADGGDCPHVAGAKCYGPLTCVACGCSAARQKGGR